MLLIRCPWCGERDEVEFRYGGAAHVSYPADPEQLDDARLEPLPLLPPQPAGARSPSAGCTRPAAGAGSTSCATRARTRSRARTCPASARSTPGEARAGRRADRSPGTAPADVGRRAAAGPGRRHPRLRAARRRARRGRPQRRAGAGARRLSRPGRRSRTRGSASTARGTSRWWRPRACRPWKGWSRAAPRDAGGCSRTRCATGTRSAGRTATCSWSARGRPGLWPRSPLPAPGRGRCSSTPTTRSAATCCDAAGHARRHAGPEWAAAALAEIHAQPEARVLLRTDAMGAYDGNAVLLVERVADGRPPRRPPGCRAAASGRCGRASFVLATGELRAADRLPRQRPPRRDAGRRRTGLRRRAGRSCPSARSSSPRPTRGTARRSTWPPPASR